MNRFTLGPHGCPEVWVFSWLHWPGLPGRWVDYNHMSLFLGPPLFFIDPAFLVCSPASHGRAGCSLLGSFKVKGYQIIHLALRYCVGCFWSFRSPYGLWNQFIDIAKIISWDLGNWIRRSCISASNLLILEPDASLLLLQSSASFSHQGLYFFLIDIFTYFDRLIYTHLIFGCVHANTMILTSFVPVYTLYFVSFVFSNACEPWSELLKH